MQYLAVCCNVLQCGAVCCSETSLTDYLRMSAANLSLGAATTQVAGIVVRMSQAVGVERNRGSEKERQIARALLGGAIREIMEEEEAKEEEREEEE